MSNRDILIWFLALCYQSWSLVEKYMTLNQYVTQLLFQLLNRSRNRDPLLRSGCKEKQNNMLSP